MRISSTSGTGRTRSTTSDRRAVWGEGAASYLGHAATGEILFIEGQLCTRKWADSTGVERISTEVVVRSRADGQVRLLGDRTSQGDVVSARALRDREQPAKALELSF